MRQLARALAVGSFVAISAVPGAQAQQYPSQDIHFICAFPPGSGADIVVRFYAEKVRALAGRNIIVENKPGAASNIATEYLARSKPDGHTIYIHPASSVGANMHLFKNPPVDVGKAIQIAAPLNKQPYMLLVDAKRPWKTVADLTAYLKEKKDKASYATTNPSAKVMGAIYKHVTKVEAVEVSYRTSGDTINDMQSGALDYAFQDPIFSTSQARAGRMRILAVSTGERTHANPEIPTMKESGIPMDLLGWFAAMVPMGTPRPVVDQINKWFNQVNSTEEAKKFLNNSGGDPWISTPDEGQARLLKDIKDWGEYVRAAKIEPQG
ncbi:MAG TPA: tripartite tricarboxylate transporter substrate binding protein [Xanthobacteraceae bacterium]|nr:tripartite tricarboxylate transporter substrate binding protein [Xanthobacteraceae bacterium]